MTPPASAPSVVVTSSVMPRRVCVVPRPTYTIWAADDVAITLTRLQPMAVLMGTPRKSVRIGTSMRPPPMPSMLPTTPTATATSRIATKVMSASRTGRP